MNDLSSLEMERKNDLGGIQQKVESIHRRVDERGKIGTVSSILSSDLNCQFGLNLEVLFHNIRFFLRIASGLESFEKPRGHLSLILNGL